MGASISVIAILITGLLAFGGLVALILLLRAVARSGAGPGIGLGLIAVAAGLLFVAYGIEQRLWSERASAEWGWIFLVSAIALALIGLVIVASPRPVEGSPGTMRLSRSTWILLAVLAAGLAALPLFFLAFIGGPMPPTPPVSEGRVR